MPARRSKPPRRNPPAPERARRGGVTMQMLVLLVPVFFGILGFGLDLGRLYLVRGELSQAAEAMALAAARELIGTDRAADNAAEAAQLLLDNTGGFGNKYNFGSLPIGEGNGLLASEVSPPVLFATAAEALSADAGAGGSAGAEAKYVRIQLRADAPLVFWAVLSLGRDRKTPIAAAAVAGVSAPLCTACGIEPFAIAALSAEDPVDFGFVAGTKYTFAYTCNGQPQPQPLAGSSQVLRYLLLNRFNDQIAIEESQQLYRIGAQGLLPAAAPGLACITIGAEEQVWPAAAPGPCLQGRPRAVQSAVCGLASRFDPVVPEVCSFVPDVETLAASYEADIDTADQDDYAAYAGYGRRVITVPVVDVLNPTAAMTPLGFRQFLVEPNQDEALLNAGDQFGRFRALYLGSVMPVRQGRFDGGCGVLSGPGKVVLHQ